MSESEGFVRVGFERYPPTRIPWKKNKPAVGEAIVFADTSDIVKVVAVGDDYIVVVPWGIPGHESS